jgi:hypothetical protein
MKAFTLQNRLAVVSILGLFALAVFMVLDAQPSDLAQMQSGTSYGAATDGGVIAQIESVFSMSAKQVFNEDYWIANMHSIKSF